MPRSGGFKVLTVLFEEKKNDRYKEKEMHRRIKNGTIKGVQGKKKERTNTMAII